MGGVGPLTNVYSWLINGGNPSHLLNGISISRHEIMGI